MRISVSESGQFILRVAGLFLHEGKVLLHRAAGDPIWALPGGGCEFGENTVAALIREAMEELGATIEVGALAFTVENFFTLNGVKAHEVGFYYETSFAGESKKFYELSEFEGIEDRMAVKPSCSLEFQWFPVEELKHLQLKPDFLRERIADLAESSVMRGKRSGSAHVVNRD